MADEEPPFYERESEKEDDVLDTRLTEEPQREDKKIEEERLTKQETEAFPIQNKTPPSPTSPTHRQLRYIRRLGHSPLYTPSFNHKDWSFFAGLILVTILSFATRLYTLNEPPHVA